MANQPETSSFDAGVYQLETADPVQGGVGGVANSPLLNLANRTRWLYNQITSILTTIAGLATLNSPALTGTPTAPTPAAGDSSTKIANTAFVDNAVFGQVAVNCAGGANVVLTAAQYGAGFLSLTGVLTANINVIFPAGGKWVVKNGTTGAFTVTCKTAAGAGVVIGQGQLQSITSDGANIVLCRSEFASVGLTGFSTTSTPGTPDNSTAIANTAWVRNQGFATLASPVLTGTPTAPTAAAADNTLKVANTGWVWANIQTLVANCIGNVATSAGFAASMGTVGYVKFPAWLGGVIIQWGSVAGASPFTVNFAAVFPNACLGVVTTIASSTDQTLGINVEDLSTASFVAHPNHADAGTTLGFLFIAIGY